MTPDGDGDGDGDAGKEISEIQKKKLSAAFSGNKNPQASKIGENHLVFGHRKTDE